MCINSGTLSLPRKVDNWVNQITGILTISKSNSDLEYHLQALYRDFCITIYICFFVQAAMATHILDTWVRYEEDQLFTTRSTCKTLNKPAGLVNSDLLWQRFVQLMPSPSLCCMWWLPVRHLTRLHTHYSRVVLNSPQPWKQRVNFLDSFPLKVHSNFRGMSGCFTLKFWT